MNVNATRGSTGHALVGGFDIHGRGIQVDSSYRDSTIYKNTPDKSSWTNILLNTLLKSDKSALNLLASELINKGYDKFDECKYTSTKRTHFIILDGYKYTVQGTKILKNKE